jgi:hypothetical protein
VTDDELDLLALKWLQVCATCDAGLPYGCSHPDEDYRPVIADLIDEVRRVRAEIAAAEHRGAERAAQAIEKMPLGRAVAVGNVGTKYVDTSRTDYARAAREAVPAPIGDNT